MGKRPLTFYRRNDNPRVGTPAEIGTRWLRLARFLCRRVFLCRNASQLGDYAFQFPHNSIGSGCREDFQQGVEVPYLEVAPTLETFPDLGADFAVVLEDG